MTSPSLSRKRSDNPNEGEPSSAQKKAKRASKVVPQSQYDLASEDRIRKVAGFEFTGEQCTWIADNMEKIYWNALGNKNATIGGKSKADYTRKRVVEFNAKFETRITEDSLRRITESMLNEVKRVEIDSNGTGNGDIVEDGVVIRTLQEVQEHNCHFFHVIHRFINERFDHESLEPFELTENKASSSYEVDSGKSSKSRQRAKAAGPESFAADIGQAMVMDAELRKLKYDDEKAIRNLELSRKEAEIDASKKLEDMRVKMAEEELRSRQLQNRREEIQLREREMELRGKEMELRGKEMDLSQKGIMLGTLKDRVHSPSRSPPHHSTAVSQ